MKTAGPVLLLWTVAVMRDVPALIALWLATVLLLAHHWQEAA
jgi:hypothetical protein